MKIAVVQPYFFPYIGYLQLMNAVDICVMYDDVQYMKGGWVNRNRIRLNDASAWLTVPVQRASHVLAINQRQYRLKDEGVLESMASTLHRAYEGAAHWTDHWPFVKNLLMYSDTNVARFNTHLLSRLAELHGISCRILLSSGIDKPANLRGQEKLIDLCLRVGADHYVNPIGGIDLYESTSFEDAGIKLSFIETGAPPTLLKDGPAHLSIIDGLMHDGVQTCRDRLSLYRTSAGRRQ